MKNNRTYINQFFDDLEMYEDVSRGHNFKAYIQQAVLEFIEHETKENAFAVYESFFDSYRIKLPGESNSFIDLLDVLNHYEMNAATLIDQHRDHYVHAVNVFILGLCIYGENKNYQEVFIRKNLNKGDYPNSYNTAHEEFFYRWGIASLFHDVAYPIEIINKQAKKFVDFVTNLDGGTKTNVHLEFDDFREMNSIPEILAGGKFSHSYQKKYRISSEIDLLKPIDLLAHKLHLSLAVNLSEIKKALDNYLNLMKINGFIDHGFFSAIIILRWYGFLIQTCKYKPDYFYFPVLDSASAILLHNYYKAVIMKPPFNLQKLSANNHPIAYLLILCDELQEWNREAYGIYEKMHTHAGEVSLFISDNRLEVTYLSFDERLPESFSIEKEKVLHNLIDISSIFNNGFSISCEMTTILSSRINFPDRNTTLVSRPLLEYLEKMAITIHSLYNQKQLERNPDKPLAYPRFSDLPDSLKYSNIRQARSIAKKVELLGCEIKPKDSAGELLAEIPDMYIEKLARFEHEDWLQERLMTGWVYGEMKNVQEKISPYIVSFDDLPEEIRDYDRDTIRNIPFLLDTIGLGMFKINQPKYGLSLSSQEFRSFMGVT